MAKALSQAAFDREFRGHLERFTQPLGVALRKMIATPVPAVVKVQVFEISSWWGRFPVQAFAMDDASPDEVYFKRPFSGAVLPGKKVLVPRGAIDQDAYERAGVATFESAAKLVAKWFHEHWRKAGGATFPIPAYIRHSGRSRYLNLRNGRWVDGDSIWPDYG